MERLGQLDASMTVRARERVFTANFDA